MLKKMIGAALAATLALVPQAADARRGHAPVRSIARVVDVAPGQSKADYYAWLARSPENRAAVLAFRARLETDGVDQVVPMWQLIRTSSSWRQCRADRFEVAPQEDWDHIITTLKFIDTEVVPAIGPVQAVSGFRNEGLNRCSAGAPASAHRLFYALDLVPVNASVTRGELIRDICAVHARDGQTFSTGLGFYNGVRFHIDSNGYRRWGPNGSSATSPCVTYV
jgi:hypothetical protein